MCFKPKPFKPNRPVPDHSSQSTRGWDPEQAIVVVGLKEQSSKPSEKNLNWETMTTRNGSKFSRAFHRAI